MAVLLVAVLFARPINGSRRWFGLGGFGIQPSELAKVAAIFFTALTLERRMHRINDVKYALTPIALIVGCLAGLILLEPDFGTSVALAVVVAAMVMAAGLSFRYILGLAIVLVPVGYVVLISAPYRLRRLVAFWNPEADPLGDGFHLLQSLIAVGSGGWLGRGLMGGIQKLFYLPEPHNDFIFAVIAEELGLVGATFVVACFGVIAWRGLKAAATAPDRFGAFLALGITMMVVAQALVNVSVVLGLHAHQGHSAAAREQRRVVAARQPGQHRRAAEHLAARGPRCGRRGAGSRVIRARTHCRRRHWGTPVPGYRRGRRADTARRLLRGELRRHGARAGEPGGAGAGLPWTSSGAQASRGSRRERSRAGSHCCRCRPSTRGGCCRALVPTWSWAWAGTAPVRCCCWRRCAALPRCSWSRTRRRASPIGGWHAGCARRR